jgi:hypothetical protein
MVESVAMATGACVVVVVVRWGGWSVVPGA